MKLDRPGRTRNSVAGLRTSENVRVFQEGGAFSLTALANADLHTRIDDVAFFTAGKMIAEKVRVVVHLFAAFKFGVREVCCNQRVKLAAVRSENAGAVAKQLAWPRRREEPNFGTGEIIAVAPALQDQLRDLRRHNRVEAIGAEKTPSVDPAHPENHRGILNPAIIADEGRKPSHSDDIGIAGSVDRHLSFDVD